MAMRLENTADVRSYIYYAYICVSIPRSLCEQSVYLPDFTPVAPVASNIRTTSCALGSCCRWSRSAQKQPLNGRFFENKIRLRKTCEYCWFHRTLKHRKQEQTDIRDNSHACPPRVNNNLHLGHCSKFTDKYFNIHCAWMKNRNCE